MKQLILGFGLLMSLPNVLLAQSKAEIDQASIYGKEASSLILRAVSYDKAINLLEKAKYLDPSNILYHFYEAQIFSNQYKFNEVVSTLTPLLPHEDVTPQVYQLLGITYKKLTQYDNAIKAYEQGLEKFPNSGMLYHEIGVVQYKQKAYNKAMASWEQGIEANPNYASNYFSLGKLLSYSDETIWAVLYGEIFMNLEPTTERSEEMSQILFRTYNKSIHLSSDPSKVQFTKEAILSLSKAKDAHVSFPFIYGLSMVKSIASEISNKNELSLSALYSIREKFIVNWFQEKTNKEYPNELFDFQRSLIKKGYSEAYNYWIFMHANKDEFKTWVNTHQKEFNTFVEWFKKHRVKHTKKVHFSRTHYRV